MFFLYSNFQISWLCLPSFPVYYFCAVSILSQSYSVSFYSIIMVEFTSLATKIDVISWGEGVDSFYFNFILKCEFCIYTWLFTVIKETPEESGNFPYNYVHYQGEQLEDVLSKGLVYHCEFYFYHTLILYHEHFCTSHFVLFYHDDTVAVLYKK